VSIAFLVPGDLDTLTGGYAYDRQIIGGLRATGWDVDVLGLQGAAEQIADIPDGRVVVADGLAFGVIPDIVTQHAQRLRWVALVHHPLALETGLSERQSQQLFESEQRALASARLVIVTSPATATALGRYGLPASRIQVVEPGTHPAPLATGSLNGLSLLCVATVTPRKGHEVLIEALCGLQDRAWTLHCVGSLNRNADTARALRAAIAMHGMSERIHLHGEVDEAQLAARYAQADVFVLPSFHEGYGMVLAEALAHGLPIVSTTAGAIPDTVPREAGLLLPPGDALALRAALAQLLDDAGLRASLAAGARTARAGLPGWPHAVAEFAQALKRLPP
jgi:glycosyltransferase involved in cell wall biosynthesis